MSDLESCSDDNVSLFGESLDFYEPSDSESSSESDHNAPGPSTKTRHLKNKSKPKNPLPMRSSDAEEEVTQPIKMTRKSVNTASWKRNVIKSSIALGKSYVNWKGKEIEARKTGPDCKC